MRRTIVITLACALSLTLFAFAAPAGAEPMPADTTLLVQGHGWGHGRGMGQWGARGMAQSGNTYTQILTHYYSGITLGSRSTSENIRVLVESSPSVITTSDSVFSAWTGSTQLSVSDSTYKFFRARYNGSAYVLEKSTAWNGSWSAVKTASGAITFKPGSSVLQLVLDSGSVKYYRGAIESRWSSVSTMYAINDLLMQHYLYGSVPREMPASWPAEGLKAQAVAARSYAAYKKDYQRSKGYAYDICATTACQVYGGYASKSSPASTSVTKLEYSSTNSAVDATAGKVMLYGGKPILAEYSSSTGGYTAPGNTGYLTPVPDSGDAVSPLHDWDTTIRVSEVEAKWPSIGRLVDIRATERNGYGDWGGRVLSLDVVGTSDTVTMSGYSFSNAFAWPGRADGMYGNWFRVLVYKGELAAAPRVPAVFSGSTATMSVLAKNSGNVAWPVGGTVRLATTVASPFYGSGWISNTRPASVTLNRTAPSKSSVAPGEIAEFRFTLNANGLRPSLYRQTFKVTNDGVTGVSPEFTVDIPVYPSWLDEAPNLLTNGSFEGSLTGWTPANLGSGEGATTAAARHGRWSVVFKSGTNTVTQRVALAGIAGRRFSLSGWSTSTDSNARGGPIALTAILRYADGSTGSTAVQFPRGAHAWSYGEASFLAAKPVAAIDVIASNANQSGTASFDALRLEETPLANGSFESGMSGWTSTGLRGADGSIQGDMRDGGRWLRLSPGADVRQTLPLSGGATTRFVVSAWNKLSGAGDGAEPPNLRAVFVNTDGTRSPAQLVFDAADHGWTYADAVVRAPKPYRAIILVAKPSSAGTTGFDAVRFRQSWLANPGFEQQLDSWNRFGFTDGDGLVAIPREGVEGLKLTGSGRQGVFQHVPLRSGPGKRVVIDAYTKAVGTSASGGVITVLVVFANIDGTTTRVWMPMDRSAHDWKFSEQTATATKAFQAVDVYLIVDNQPGYVVFDGLGMTLA